MGQAPDQYDFFVSYARHDNRDGWIAAFLAALDDEHCRFSGGRTLTYFFDQHNISCLSDWQEQIFNKGLARSRLFVAFLSPAYFASEWCRREWKSWIDLEIAQYILTAGAAPIYIVEVPGFVTKPMLSEHEVARKVAELCDVPAPHEAFQADVSPVVKEFRRRQLNLVQPFYQQGVAALQQTDLRQVLEKLGKDLDDTGHEHPHSRAAVQNYRGLLRVMGLDDTTIERRVREVLDGK